MLHFIATAWTLTVLTGSLILLHGMIKQDWHKITAALQFRPIPRDRD